MKRLFFFLIGAVLLVTSCAKSTSTSSGASAKAYFDAWMQVNYPGLTATPLGSYVIEETEGDGALLGTCEESKYIRVHATAYDLKGNVTNTTRESVAKQLGLYSERAYYGPMMWIRTGESLYAGLDEAVSTMKVGGRKKTIIPGWLFSYTRYNTPQAYIDNVSGANAIYDIEIKEIVNDPVKWEIDSISSYLSHNYPSVTVADSLKFGFYYIQDKAPSDTAKFPNDTTIYINYIGRLLDGRVFDTNIKDTAKVHGLYSSSATYGPSSITYKDEVYSDITMGSSGSLIDGFSYAIWKMRHHEKGTCIFYSNLGYGAAGSGSSIPAFSPLRFDIEIVDKK